MKFCIYPAAKTQAWEQKSVGPIVWTVEGSLVWMEIKSRNVVLEMENENGLIINRSVLVSHL